LFPGICNETDALRTMERDRIGTPGGGILAGSTIRLTERYGAALPDEATFGEWERVEGRSRGGRRSVEGRKGDVLTSFAP